jgi:hypothetical protein
MNDLTIEEALRRLLEAEEVSTVGDAFGGVKSAIKAQSFSVAKIRDELISSIDILGDSELKTALLEARAFLPPRLFKLSIGNLIRFAFLIELTNLTVGSTKMKTRWVSGFILMSQPNSYEPIKGNFKPDNDPRSSSYEDCLQIFIKCLFEIVALCKTNSQLIDKLLLLDKYSSIPYEFVFDYINPKQNPVHVAENIQFTLNEDLEWLLLGRPLIKSVVDKKLLDKIQTKTYKTDRALTGKDKTNRAKRWEVIAGDFQHASLTECWSVEKKLYEGLILFKDFPADAKKDFLEKKLIKDGGAITKCPVTYEELSYTRLIGDSVHGKAEYQVGHAHPLKRGGRHSGANVCWQSADGNRIQGDLTLEETKDLMANIFKRMNDV